MRRLGPRAAVPGTSPGRPRPCRALPALLRAALCVERDLAPRPRPARTMGQPAALAGDPARAFHHRAGTIDAAAAGVAVDGCSGGGGGDGRGSGAAVAR